MKIVTPKPFTFEAGERAVLLLHGFTGNTADVRMLGRFLQKKGYTCHAPLYKGHGVSPEQLVQTGPCDWWQDVKQGYDHLKEAGHEEIAVCGLSLGGVFSLKMGYTLPVKGIVTMCAPMTVRKETMMAQGVLGYAEKYKRFEKKSEEQIKKELEQLKNTPMEGLKQLQLLINEVRGNLDMIYTPTFVIQARHDEVIDPNSANIIYNEVECDQKQIKWYEHSSHIITFDKEKEQLHKDVYEFLETLDWSI